MLQPASSVAGGTAAVVNAVKNSNAGAEQEKHRRALEEEFKKSGSGILSNIASRLPVVG